MNKPATKTACQNATHQAFDFRMKQCASCRFNSLIHSHCDIVIQFALRQIKKEILFFSLLAPQQNVEVIKDRLLKKGPLSGMKENNYHRWANIFPNIVHSSFHSLNLNSKFKQIFFTILFFPKKNN